MKKVTCLLGLLVTMFSYQSAYCQTDLQGFRMSGVNPETIEINQTFTADAEIFPFSENLSRVFGLALKADVSLKSENSIVRVILIDSRYDEHLIYESYPLLEPSLSASVDDICEETSIMNSIKPLSVRVEITDATVTLTNISYATNLPPGLNIAEAARNKKQARNTQKIRKINQALKAAGKTWVAGVTSVSELSYAERQMLYGQSTFPAGFEYYSGGVIQVGKSMKTATATSPYVDEFDWRNRHGENWISPIANQGSCGSCFAFAATGATEALVNLYYNIPGLNLNLSEQEVLSCSGAGSCSGGYPSTSLDYIASYGIVDEATFPYSATDQPCENKGTNPNELIKIGGRINYGYGEYPKTEDGLKKMIIEKGPISGGLYNWSHAMTLPGYMVVKDGDQFFYRDLNGARYWKTVLSGDPLIGKTVWIFKNSWGASFGDNGYVYVETEISNIGWTHALLTPVQSVVVNREVNCTDNDGDGFYWWGLGEKPASCVDCPDTPDGDDSDPTKGPLDQYGYCMVLGGAPIANFTTVNASVNLGEQIAFTDLSSGAPTTWAWNFPGGSPGTSTAKNPTVSYNVAGTFDVILTVTNADGSDIKTELNYISVTVNAPVANFSPLQASINLGESVGFSDASSNSPTSWAWTFEGGNPASSTSQNPVVNYATPGTYYVSLTSTNAGGSDSQSGTVTVKDPDNITYCSSSGDAGYEWINSFTFADMSNINNGSLGTIGYQNFSDSHVAHAVPGETYDFSLSPAFAGRSKFEYFSIWIDFNKDGDFDDGNELVASGSKVKSTTSGTVTIPLGLSVETTMRVSLSRNGVTPCGYIGLGEVEDYSINIGNPTPEPPVADFEADITVFYEGDVVNFTDLTLNEPTSWAWSFGDGKASSSQNPSNIFTTKGIYTVSLTAGNTLGSSKKIKDSYIQVLSRDEYTPMDYCIPLNINSALDFISGLEIGATMLTNSTGDGYKHFLDPVSLSPGSVYQVSLAPQNYRNRNFWKIWIDLNKDGDFDDFDETILTANNKKGLFTASISIPNYATGQTRMRVSMRTASSVVPCDDGFEGEVEDYEIDFGSGKSGMLFSGDSMEEKSFTVYPNPTPDIVFVRLNNWEGKKTIRLMDLTGRSLIYKEVAGSLIELDLSQFPDGLYLLDINDGTTRKNQKISKL